MKRFFICIICIFICACGNTSFAYTKQDLINAINKTYKVNGENFILPSSIRTKVINYINANEISADDCTRLMVIVDKAVKFANEVGTTDISKISSEDMRKAVSIVNEAAAVLDVEVKVNSELNKVVATQKETGKIVEEVEKKPAFFKSTGKEENKTSKLFLCFTGLMVCIFLYVVILRFARDKRYYEITVFIVNTVFLIYFVLIMPFMYFGNFIEIFKLLEPILSSETGEGHIEIVNVDIDEPLKATEKVEGNAVNEAFEVAEKVEGNIMDDTSKVTYEETPVAKTEKIEYPVVGEMYAKLRIPSCNIDLSVYYGDNEKILESGIGHFSGSHFPGEGNGILYTTHNTEDKLYNLKDININDLVLVKATFGEFHYKVVNIEVIKDTDRNKAFIESNKEILMIYTCYPFEAKGYTDERYMVYCERSDI